VVPIEALLWPHVGTAGSVGCPRMSVICDLDSGAVKIKLLLVDILIKLSYFIIFCSKMNFYVNKSSKDLKSMWRFFRHFKDTERV
jgi:hypothetical protein